MKNPSGLDLTNRRYDFDWLRFFGAVLVVFVHSAGIFSTWAPAFGNVQKSKLVSELLFNVNMWLMPLFMVLAGASVWLTLSKRSTREYLRERLLHLGVPAVLLTVTFGIPASYWGQAATGLFRGSLADYYLQFFDHFPSASFHLWFLFFLLVYSVLTLPLFQFLRREPGCRLTDRLARICQRTGGIYLFALPLLAVQLALSGLARPAPWAPPPNDYARFVLLLLIFIFGYLLASDKRFQQAIKRQWPIASAVALITSTVMFVIAWPDRFDLTRDVPVDYTGWYALFWTVFALSTWSWLIAWLGFGQRFLNVSHRLPEVRRFAAAASYPLYLLHPLLTGPAILLVAQWPLSGLAGSGIATAMALAGTLVLCVLVPRSNSMRILLGMKAPERPGAREMPLGLDSRGLLRHFA